MRIIRPNLGKTLAWLCYGMMCVMAAGCASDTPSPPTLQRPVPTPTVAPFFQNSTPQPSISPFLAATPDNRSSPIPSVPAPTRAADQIAAISLYDDALNADWSAEQSSKAKYDLAS